MSEYQGCDKCKSVGKDRTEFPCSRCIHNAIDHYKPMTNADRIRNMNDEELAEYLVEVVKDAVFHSEEYQEWLEWLQAEVGDEK